MQIPIGWSFDYIEPNTRCSNQTNFNAVILNGSIVTFKHYVLSCFKTVVRHRFLPAGLLRQYTTLQSTLTIRPWCARRSVNGNLRSRDLSNSSQVLVGGNTSFTSLASYSNALCRILYNHNTWQLYTRAKPVEGMTACLINRRFA